MSHRSSWGAPIWPPSLFKRRGLRPPRTPPASARTRPGAAVARLGLDTGCLIERRGGPRYGPPHPPSLGRAPAQPWRASGLTQDVSSNLHRILPDEQRDEPGEDPEADDGADAVQAAPAAEQRRRLR